MEFLGYLGRYRLITASKIVLAYWTFFLLMGGLMTAADVPSLGAFDVVFASLALVSLVLAIVISVAATIGASNLLEGKARRSVLFRLWVVPFAGALHFLAFRVDQSRVTGP